MLRSVLTSRTVLFNAIALLYALAQAHGPIPAVDPIVFAVATTVSNVILRWLTTTPLISAPASR